MIEAWREAMGHVGVVAGEVDAGLTDRYSALMMTVNGPDGPQSDGEAPNDRYKGSAAN
ncbi:MAG: hypothetical protein Ct9H300mP26_4330 [Acidimicrobiales bacterium]|nr:MAG: hypothetical protein Ct9H300mP26_4330 [Acidimicrobiales bacterium]